MSSSGTSGSGIISNGNSQPFGILKGPYKCTTFGCNFSGAAYADLRRRGWSDALLNDTDGFQNFLKTRPSADAIRSSNPRTVTLQGAGRELTESEQNAITLALSQIDALEGQLRFHKNQQALGVDNQAMIDALNTNINRYKQTISGIQDRAKGQSININGIDVVASGSASNVPENPLNCFIDVQYHISLTMLSEAEALRFQRGGFNKSGVQVDPNTLRQVQRSDSSITLASTGDTLTNNNGDRNYYNILGLTVKNVMEPSQANPLISTMLSMKMRIAEPHGFKLHEDIRDSACLLGYQNINPGRVLYRVDIYWSGYNQDTGEWTEQIDVSNGRGTTTISAVMAISNMEASVNNTGTTYEVDLVPAGHHAYRPEDFVMDAQSMLSGTTFKDFLQSMSQALANSKSNRTQGRITRKYEFFAPTALMQSQFDIDAFVSQGKFVRGQGDSNHVITSGQDIDILTMIQGALANTLVAQELFINDGNNAAFTIPRIHFAVRFNTVYGRKDNGLNDYNDITHQYIIEPYITFKHGAVTERTMNDYVDPQSQLIRIREIIRMGMLRRIYNYMYTSENTEVLDFDIRLKSFYYNSLNTTARSSSSGGIDTTQSANDIANRQAVQNNLFKVIAGGGQTFFNVENTIRRLFGNYKYDLSSAGTSSGACPRVGADRLGGGYNESPFTKKFGDVVSPAHKNRDAYDHHMGDYLALDLLRLNGMQVRGDPVWLLSPYANIDVDALEKLSDTEGVAENSSSNSIQVRPRGGQIIFLKIFPPEQDDHMNPNRARGSDYPNIIGGFYQILDVTSTFSDGRFTQSIEGAKLNHLNYAEQLFERAGAGSPLVAQNQSSLSNIGGGNRLTGPSTGIPPANSSAIPSPGPIQASPPNTNFVGGPDQAHVEQAYRFFASQGFQPFQAAAIVGNLMQESGQGLDTSALGDSGTALGIAQWRFDRRSGLIAFANSQGLNPGSLDAQLRYVVHELNTTESAAKQAFLQATNVTDATIVFAKKYERCGTCHNGSRIAYAKGVLQTFGGGG